MISYPIIKTEICCIHIYVQYSVSKLFCLFLEKQSKQKYQTKWRPNNNNHNNNKRIWDGWKTNHQYHRSKTQYGWTTLTGVCQPNDLQSLLNCNTPPTWDTIPMQPPSSVDCNIWTYRNSVFHYTGFNNHQNHPICKC